MIRKTNIQEIRKLINDTIPYAFQYCAYYYSLYYLYKVLNVRELKHEFEQVERQLADAFFYYGIYSVGHELCQFRSGFDTYCCDEVAYPYPVLEDKPLEYRLKWIITEAIRRGTLPKLRANEMVKLVNFMYKFYYSSELMRRYNYDLFRFLEGEFRAFSKPKEFLKLAELTFRIKFTIVVEEILGDSDEENFFPWDEEPIVIANYYRCGWQTTGRYIYGGEMWAKIARTMLLRYEVPTSAFIDLCWNLQHNIGNWLSGDSCFETPDLMKVLDLKRRGKLREIIDLLIKRLNDYKIIYGEKCKKLTELRKRIFKVLYKYYPLLPNPYKIR